MASMQCNVEFGYQLSICSETKENHGKPSSSWPVAGPSGCKLTSSQQPGIKSANPNLCCCVFSVFFRFFFLFYEVEFTLRPTVSRPVRLGVLPLLEQVTRCYIYLSDNLTNEKWSRVKWSEVRSVFSYSEKDNSKLFYEVTLRPTISRPVRLGIRRPSGPRDQFFILFEIFF
jgi:hypothetical protein